MGAFSSFPEPQMGIMLYKKERVLRKTSKQEFLQPKATCPNAKRMQIVTQNVNFLLSTLHSMNMNTYTHTHSLTLVYSYAHNPT